MKNWTIPLAIVVMVLLGLGAVCLFSDKERGMPVGQTATSTETGQANAQTVTTPAGLSFTYADPYGLATSPEQVLVKSYIPSCLGDFDYCIYRTGDQYAGTNFESAGIAIQQRKDLTTKTACLTEPPMGYENQKVTTLDQSGYATSVSGPLGNGAAGHYSDGYQYRLWYGTTCYEFNAQIGESNYGNYPTGTKTEFTAADRAAVMKELTGILAHMSVNGTKITFPQSEAGKG